MTKEIVFNKVQSIFRDVFDEPDLLLQETTMANDIEDWDSMAQISLLSAMEEKFSIKFQIDDVLNLNNVGEMILLIQKKLS